jgi:hypothetical protein
VTPFAIRKMLVVHSNQNFILDNDNCVFVWNLCAPSLVSSLVSCVAVVSSLVQFGARRVRFMDLGLPGLDRSDRHSTSA